MRRLSLFLVAVSLLAVVPATAADLPRHRVLSDEQTDSHRKIRVRIEARLSEADVAALADALRRRDRTSDVRTFVELYLPAMDLAAGTWATVAYAPDRKITINGLKREEEQAFLDELAADRRDILGAWLTAPPAAPGRLVIFRDGKRLYAEWRLRAGEKTVEEVVEAWHPRGKRYDIATGASQHYLVTKARELELRDDKNLIAVATPVRREAPQPQTAKAKSLPSPLQPVAAANPELPAPTTPASPAAAPASVTAVEPKQAEPAAAPQVKAAAVAKPVAARPKPQRVIAAAPPRPQQQPRQTSVGDLTRQQFMR